MDPTATTTSTSDENSAAAPESVNAFTVLFNAVEIANRRGAYSLKESAMISRALDAVRQAQPPTPPEAVESAETTEGGAAQPEPTIA